MAACDVDQLIPALQRRDTSALERLYDAVGRRAYGLAYRIVGDHGAAEDTVQEAFMDLWQKAARIDPARGSLQSLLLTMVHHKAIDRLRKQRGQSRLYSGIEVGDLQDSLASAEDLETLAVDRDYVRMALDALPVEQGQTVMLAYFEGYTQAEIALMMKVPLGTTKSRLRLAMERLRTLLTEREERDLRTGG